MHAKKTHSIFRISALLLILALLLPASLAFIHSAQDHDHIDHCELVSDTHMHEKDLDCDFDDIALNKVAEYAFAKAQLTPTPFYSKIGSIYTPWIPKEHKQTDSSRGPPAC